MPAVRSITSENKVECQPKFWFGGMLERTQALLTSGIDGVTLQEALTRPFFSTITTNLTHPQNINTRNVRMGDCKTVTVFKNSERSKVLSFIKDTV